MEYSHTVMRRSVTQSIYRDVKMSRNCNEFLAQDRSATLKLNWRGRKPIKIGK